MAEPLYLREWARGLRIEHVAHRRACVHNERLGRYLGAAVVVITAIVGTSVFASIKTTPNTGLRVAAGLLSLIAAVVAALQTFFGFDGRAARHREAAMHYGALRRELEQLRGGGSAIDDATVSEIRRRWDEIDGGAPPVSNRIHVQARDLVEAAEAAAKS